MSSSHQFLNPYTFVPAFPRCAPPCSLADGPPPGRDALRGDAWSGRIGVTLTVRTPLLLLDSARSGVSPAGEGGHRVYPARVRNGRPHLAATSVKGMLRAAFEAATNSRMGVFEGHGERLGFRRDAEFALQLKPVYVAREGVLYEFRMASIKMYESETGEHIHADPPEHREPIRATVGRGKYGDVVTDFVPHSSRDQLRPARGERVVEGRAYVTGPNIEGKHSERFFYMGANPECLLPAHPWSKIRDDWEQLIQNYRKAHAEKEINGRVKADGKKAAPGERIGKGPGRLAWSPHLYDPKSMELDERFICYARVDKGEVYGLYPVLVPRDLYPVAPADLLDKSLHPATTLDELSPADRVFGWVAPQGKGVRQAAYRGRLRIGPVTCDQDARTAVRRFDGDGLALAVLSKPKPHQGRFYLAAAAKTPQLPLPDGTPKEMLYQAGRALRGRKAYWHHAGLDPQHWNVPQAGPDPAQILAGGHYREYVRPREPASDNDQDNEQKRRYRTTSATQRDSQNRSITGWVAPGTTFRFTIEVRDLDKEELGALAWLLSLPEDHFHRLGLGRPLGFGSVRLDIDPATTELHSGDEYAAYYRSLSGELPETDATEILRAARAEFDGLVESHPELTEIRAAMLAVARGNPGMPVHYPRTRPGWLLPGIPAPPNPSGRNYEWFTENDRKGGPGRSLPAATEHSRHLVVHSAKKPDKRR
ncbi:TIGR03986 family type III CRISPR-associated RAMP protein [Spongiactinospora gelatinilytica]|uniref:TIGR03986 family type III CRISPR-associated RAMP protein n=1 Tax=Spongiactinospora gelatinilytica TaxID=2666298 RepID=UPI001314DCBC|nr:TIGR03986 family CRISPR-associated RAMP protein [Spongiactinospora gelatinilytica]